MITYIKGDATQPKNKPAIICHICNDVKKWGRGFVLALSKRWKEPERQYRRWGKNPSEFNIPFKLGETQFVPVEEDIIVANMIGQHDIYPIKGVQPIRYEAVGNCLEKVYNKAEELGSTVHMPRIGCGLAGGSWKNIEKILNNTATVDTYVYDL